MKLVLAVAEGEAHFGLLDEVRDELGLEIARARTPDEVLAAVADADVLYGFPSAEIVEVGRNLRWIQASSAGVDFVTRIPSLVESDIVLTNTRGAHGPSIGEHVLALLLALTRRIPSCVEWQRQRRWARQEGYRTSREIRGGTMGIVGFGAIGRAVAQRALGFDLNLLAVDAHAGSGDPYLAEVWPPSRLPELLAASDFVVICVPYTPETHHLFDAAMLARMKADALLIAVSRGGIVVEADLATALVEGRIGGAAIDVAEKEPLSPDSPLWDAPNLLITPHLAGDSPEKERRCVEILRDNLRRFARGEPLHNVVDKRLGY